MNAQNFIFGMKMFADRTHIGNAFGIGNIDHQTVGQNAAKIRDLKIPVGNRFLIDLQIQHAVFKRLNRTNARIEKVFVIIVPLLEMMRR